MFFNSLRFMHQETEHCNIQTFMRSVFVPIEKSDNTTSGNIQTVAALYHITANPAAQANEETTKAKKDDVVRIKPTRLGQRDWKKGIVTSCHGDRSYRVETEDCGGRGIQAE